MFFKELFKFFAALNANTRPAEIGAAMACALMLALIPSGNLTWYILFILFFLTKLNTGALFVFLFLFKLGAPLLDPLTDYAGYLVLSLPVLQGFFRTIINLPVIPFTAFNQTLVTGGFVLGLILWIPFYVLGIQLVKLYRNKIRAKIVNSKWFIKIQKIPMVAFFTDKIGKAGQIYRLGR